LTIPDTWRRPEQPLSRCTHSPPALPAARDVGAAERLVPPGVTIGARSVIGAASLVTADIPPDTLAFGQPFCVQRALEPNDRA
jgi:serine acetyltransferase